MGSRTDRSTSRRGRTLGILVAILAVFALTAVACSGGSSKKTLNDSGQKTSSDSGSSNKSSKGNKGSAGKASSDSSSFSDSSNLSDMFSGDSGLSAGGGDLAQNPTFRSSFLKSCESGLSEAQCNCILGKLHGSNVSDLTSQARDAARECVAGG